MEMEMKILTVKPGQVQLIEELTTVATPETANPTVDTERGKGFIYENMLNAVVPILSDHCR